MPRPIQAQIHLTALSHNLSVVKQRAPNAKIWAVVKANAYGHSVAHVYPGLKKADGFALLDLAEAALLRQLGWQGPILLLEGIFTPSDLAVVEHLKLTIVVHSEEQLRLLEQTPLTYPIAVYLKMNSGMNRLGFKPPHYFAAWQRLRALAWVNEITLMTHFSEANNADKVVRQINIFKEASENISAPHSMANSAAILWQPQTHADWVRPGIILYGASPNGISHEVNEHNLQPSMTLSSEIIATQVIQAKETIGYNGRFTASHKMRIGVVACGYADGYPRHAPDGTPVLVNGILTQLVGCVSMDMLCVDITSISGAIVGSTVELWGAQLLIDDVAKACGTIGYELMCARTPRVPIIAR
ncbi:MAG: alanine racemase [Ottowia sp.]|nr:alanine racemase [Ottowia sp.]